MHCADFMTECALAGFDFEDDGDRLIVRPKEKITDELRLKIKHYKPIILRILKAESAIDILCKKCGAPGITWDGYCEGCIDSV